MSQNVNLKVREVVQKTRQKPNRGDSSSVVNSLKDTRASSSFMRPDLGKLVQQRLRRLQQSAVCCLVMVMHGYKLLC